MTVTRDPDARETDPRWSGFDGLFGGYVVGLLADTAVARSAYRLVSLTANFVSRVAVGPVAVRTETLHRGRSTELLRLLLEQDGRVRVHATAELLHLPDPAPAPASADAPAWVRTTSPGAVAAPSLDVGRGRLPFDDVIDLRRTSVPRMADPATSWARIRPEAAGGGLRSAEAVATALLDAPTPGLFGEPEPPAFVPTIDYAVHLAPDAGEWDPAGWLRLDHATAWATRQHCVDEVHAWTADGRLLATLRQTRAVWWPPAGTEESA